MLRCVEQREASVQLRLVCIPHAGGSAANYANWAEDLPETIELWTVAPPGRAARAAEPAFESLSAYANALADEIVAHISGPFALFGHSFGSLVALTVADILRARELPLPLVLAVSAHGAPCDGLPDAEAALSTLSSAPSTRRTEPRGVRRTPASTSGSR